MTAVVFVPADFKVRYPEFSGVLNATLTAYFNESTLYLSNADTSPVSDISRRTLLLWMLTAHVAQLNGALSTNGKAPPVGRTSSASEGSVSVGLDYGASTPGSGMWFSQTPYGAAFWQATVALRRFQYRRRPTIWR